MAALKDLSRPRDLVGSVLLLLLKEEPGHGYDLGKRLADEGFCFPTTAGPVYAELSKLEEAGFIRSALDLSTDEGPKRRVYQLTTQGIRELERRMEMVSSLASYTQNVIQRYRTGRTPQLPEPAPPSKSSRKYRRNAGRRRRPESAGGQ